MVSYGYLLAFTFPIMKTTFLLSVIALLMFSAPIDGTSSVANIQLQNRPADSSRIITVDYPPATAREGVRMNIPTPPAEHPRLFFRKKDIPALVRKSEHALMRLPWDKIRQAAIRQTDGSLKTDDAMQNLDNDVRDAIEAKALLYAFTKDPRMGREAVDAVLNFYRTLKIDLSRHDICRVVGRAILTGSVVYDWCYDLLSDAQKETLIGRMETLAVSGLEVQWPEMVQGSVTGHGSEAQLARDMLACGVATYDEKPVIYERVAGRILAEFAPARKFFYPASYHHQGSSYGPYRFLWDMWATFIFDRMGYPQIFGADQAKVPYRFIYLRRPDGQLLRDGDDFIEAQNAFGKYWLTGSVELAASYFADPVLMGEAIKQGRIGQTADYLFDYLFFNPDVQPQFDKSHLPLTRYFDEPLGAMIARTGWDDGLDAETAIAEMKIGTMNFANHQHLDAGSFQLYYKGPLAPESGVYEGKKGAYGSEHFKNYYQRTIAHNTMLIYDTNEKFLWQGQEVINDGGQHFPNGGREPLNLDMLQNGKYESGKVLAHHYGPDDVKPEYSFIKGDLTKAYGQKVDGFTRSFVFLNFDDQDVPAALVVYDRVTSTNKEFKKYWLLHSVEEPVIDGATTEVQRTEKGYNGKLINTSLLPLDSNREVTKIGGRGQEYSVFGQNFDQPFRNPGKNSSDSAMWRVQISPRSSAAEDHFLNVMQVMENEGTAAPLRVELLKQGQLIGAGVGNRVVFFSADESLLKNRHNITLRGDRMSRVLVTDLEEGHWSVARAGDTKKLLKTLVNESGVLYFEAAGGEYIISRIR